MRRALHRQPAAASCRPRPGLEACAGPRLIANPGTRRASPASRPSDAVLVLGSGLTMVDVAILLADRGHRGPILALSRHGMLPREHAPTRRRSPLAPPTELAPSARACSGTSAARSRRAEAPASTGAPCSTPGATACPCSGSGCRQPSAGVSCATCAPIGTSTATAWRPRSPPGSTRCGRAAGSRSGPARSRPTDLSRRDRGALPRPRQQHRDPDRRRLAGQRRRPDPRLPQVGDPLVRSLLTRGWPARSRWASASRRRADLR